MIKLKKIVAVALAATMCMGLGMTASAAANSWSGVRSDLENEQVWSDYYYNGNGRDVEAVNNQGEVNDRMGVEKLGNAVDLQKTLNSINLKSEVVAILEDNDIVAANGADIADLNIVPVAAANVYKLNANGDNAVAFRLENGLFDPTGKNMNSNQYVEGDTVIAMVENGEGSGVWEVREGTVNKDGEVIIDVDNTGAVILIKAMKNNKMVMLTVDEYGNNIDDPVVIDPDPINPDQPGTVVPTPDQPGTSTNPANGQNANANGAANANGTWTSPKTGEF